MKKYHLYATSYVIEYFNINGIQIVQKPKFFSTSFSSLNANLPSNEPQNGVTFVIIYL
jgi:hypothetical protein